MNRHIEEDTAGNFYIINGRRFRIARSDFYDLLLSYLSGSDSIVNGFEIVIEAAIEANLIFFASFLNDVENLFYLIDIVVNRLFTEYMLSGTKRFNRERRMLISGSADQDSIDFWIVENVMIIFGHTINAERFRPGFCLFIHKRVCDGFYRGIFDKF